MSANIVKWRYLTSVENHFFLPFFKFAAFNWDALSNLNTESSLEDLLKNQDIADFQMPQTYGELYSKFEEAKEAFCDEGG